MRKRLFVLRVCLLGILLFCVSCGKIGNPLRTCSADGCTDAATELYLDDQGERLYYCEAHYSELVPAEIQEEKAQREEPTQVCELCDEEAVLVLTDEEGTDHQYCTIHYEQETLKIKEKRAAESGAERTCDICGAPAIIATRVGDGEEHFYCVDHYGEMLDILEGNS